MESLPHHSKRCRELVESGGRQLVHALYTGTGGTSASRGLQRLDGVFGTRGSNLDPAIVVITNPPSKSGSARGLANEPPESDALYLTDNLEMNRRHPFLSGCWTLPEAPREQTQA